mmetsp:Transcript_49411/g.115533  ORF Transcript_49411/g.115533 Transcript_49411/m.115533 type:complete len:729 (+) Transcript_49411:113-2299(+)
MKASMQIVTILVVLLTSASTSFAAGAGDHPISDVILMLQGLMKKAKMSGEHEQEAYMKFEHWCRNSVSDLEKAITEEKETIEVLTDTIASKAEEKELLEKQISELDNEITNLHAASVKARTERDAEAGVYSQVSGDLTATIKAVEDALTLLEDSKTTTGHLFLAQQHVRSIMALAEARASPAQRKQLEAFLDVGRSAAPAPAPRPPFFAKGDMTEHVDQYSFKSGGVIELLKQLRLKFQDELREATEDETNDINGYQLGQLSRDNAVTAASSAKAEKAGILVETKNELARAQADLKSEQSDLAADSNSLSETESACEIKKSEWDTRTEVRSSELEAMKTAIEILSKVTGVRTDAPGNPVPPPSPAFLQKALALLQLSSGAAPSDERTAARRHAVELLREEAKATHSHALEGLAQEVAAHGDGPFNDIVNMVQKMIFQLMNEQKNEDDHKNWCDQEVNKTEAMEINKEQRIAELAAKIDAAEAEVAQLTLDIKDANALLAKIDAYVAEATTIRKVGKSENAEAVKDAQDAQTALAHAIAVLTDFYKQSGMMDKEAWEFIQQPVDLPSEPSTWSASYTGVADPTKPVGIVTILQKIAASFEEMEADTQAQEAADQKAYDSLMSTNKIEEARRTEEVAQKTQQKQRLTASITSMKDMRKHVDTELESVEQYLKDLQPACVNADSTYGDRKAARTQEIEALKDVQGILQTAFKTVAAPAPAFLQIRRHGLAA